MNKVAFIFGGQRILSHIRIYVNSGDLAEKTSGALQQARHAAVSQEKTLGQWLEEAILEKIEREQKLGKEE